MLHSKNKTTHYPEVLLSLHDTTGKLQGV